jgi:hypothetical protein
MRILAAALALLLALPAYAETVGPGCTVAWDYPPADLARIDGFRIYVDGTRAATVTKTEQTVSCAALGLSAGERVLEATAYNAVGESARSAPLTVMFVGSAPPAPANIRVQVNISVGAP